MAGSRTAPGGSGSSGLDGVAWRWWYCSLKALTMTRMAASTTCGGGWPNFGSRSGLLGRGRRRARAAGARRVGLSRPRFSSTSTSARWSVGWRRRRPGGRRRGEAHRTRRARPSAGRGGQPLEGRLPLHAGDLARHRGDAALDHAHVVAESTSRRRASSRAGEALIGSRRSSSRRCQAERFCPGPLATYPLRKGQEGIAPKRSASLAPWFLYPGFRTLNSASVKPSKVSASCDG
jgi:hypothetical protein